MYQSIIKRFPSGLSYAFAYGSGVKKQLGYDKVHNRPKMIDFILCSNNSMEWHDENLKINPKDYSFLKFMGNKYISSFQQSYGAKVYFNTLVPINEVGVMIKYGVISQEHLIEDLLDWKYLYIAGRLHKPVEDVIDPSDNIKIAFNKNLRSAVRAALLLLPKTFSDFEFFHTIANLSYGGDFRMKFGENKSKVRNIVEPQLDDFYTLYLPVIRDFSQYIAVLGNRKTFEQERSPLSMEKHLRNLPRELLNRVLSNSGVKDVHSEQFQKLVHKNNYQNIILKSVNQIVWKSSVAQSLKNIPCAGFGKSIEYSLRKISKMF